MKPHERRQQNAYPYYSLSKWNVKINCWQAGKRIYETERQAIADAKQKGRYRVVKITEHGREDLEPFDVK